MRIKKSCFSSPPALKKQNKKRKQTHLTILPFPPQVTEQHLLMAECDLFHIKDRSSFFAKGRILVVFL